MCYLRAILLFASLVACGLAAEDLYTSKYDNINVDGILQNPRLRAQYLNCYLSKGPCVTPDARFLKDKFPEALVTKCRKCTEKQKEFFSKVTEWFTENEPKTWDMVIEKTIQDYRKKSSTK